jgi:hypothetical protein
VKRFVKAIREVDFSVPVRYSVAMMWTLFVYAYGIVMGVLLGKMI